MSKQNVQKVELLRKTADYYRRSIADYSQFVQSERKPRTKHLEQRLQTILQEIESLKLDPVTQSALGLGVGTLIRKKTEASKSKAHPLAANPNRTTAE